MALKALVLAGGNGSRMRPLTHSTPKQLLPVAGRPVLVHLLRQLLAVGVESICIIVGTRRADIEPVVTRLLPEAPITYLDQARPTGLAACVELAAGYLGDDDFVMLLGDNVFAGDDAVTGIVDQFRTNRVAAHLAVSRVEDPSAFGVAELDPTDEGVVCRLTEKPSEPRSDLAVTGLYVFGPAIHEAVRNIQPSARGELEITDAIQWLIEHGQRVTAAEFSGDWYDTGQPESLLAANHTLLAQQAPAILGDIDAASTVCGTVVIDPGAVVRRSAITGPAYIGADAVVEESRIGPGTTIGAGACVRGSGVTRSILLSGAVADHVGNLVDSVLGRNAHVFGLGPDEQHCHRLVLGDDCRIEVAPHAELPVVTTSHFREAS